VILEKFVIRGRADKLPKALRVLPCCLIVFLGWVLFFSPNLGSALHYYGQMFGKGGLGLVDSVCKYYLSSNILLLLAAVLGCGPWVQRLHQRLYALHGKATLGLSVGLYVVLLVLTVAYLVSATYTSFLYFQF
jgi:alginate O-acetyltransferase complex protein AlgI